MGLRTPIEKRLEKRLTRIESTLEPMDREFQVSVTLSVRIPGLARTEFVVEETEESAASSASS